MWWYITITQIYHSSCNRNLDSNFHRIGVGSLQIEDIQESDEGIYMCRAENHEDSFDASATVQVQGPYYQFVGEVVWSSYFMFVFFLYPLQFLQESYVVLPTRSSKKRRTSSSNVKFTVSHSRQFSGSRMETCSSTVTTSKSSMAIISRSSALLIPTQASTSASPPIQPAMSRQPLNSSSKISVCLLAVHFR